MNAGCVLLFLIGLAFGGVSLALHGWTWNGLGPALLAVAAGAWLLGTEWLRDRSWHRHCNEEFKPGTQHLALAGQLGYGLGALSAGIWAFIALRSRMP